MLLYTNMMMTKAALLLLLGTLAFAIDTVSSVNASLASDKIYHWELDNLPVTISKLKQPFHLEKSLKPGKNPFDIILDPMPTSQNSSARVLRSIYPAHSYARSGHKHSSFISSPLPAEAFRGPKSRFIRLEYQMLFQPGFDWVRGGKLPGILLGSEKGCNAGCSGGGTAENCFSTRMMWRAKGLGEMYMYAARSVYFPEQPAETCQGGLDKLSQEAKALLEKRQIQAADIPEDESRITRRALRASCLQGAKITVSPGATNVCNPAYGISIGRGGAFKFRSGLWHNVTQIVRINSKGNAVRDGYLAVFLDGQAVIQAENLVVLKGGYSGNSDAGVSDQVKFMFSSFFGGSSKSYGTPVEQWIAWKGFKMTTSVNNIWQ